MLFRAADILYKMHENKERVKSLSKSACYSFGRLLQYHGVERGAGVPALPAACFDLWHAGAGVTNIFCQKNTNKKGDKKHEEMGVQI